MGMGMQEVVGKHEREGANWAAEAARAATPADNNAIGDDFANKEGRGNGITVSPPAPSSSEGWVVSSAGSSSSGGAGNEASASSENGMPASSSEDGSQQPRRWGEWRADRSYHGMHSSMSSLTHGSSFGASTSASSSRRSVGGGEANRSSAYGGSSSDGKGNDASQGRDFYVDASGSPRLCRGSGGKKRRVHYGDRGVEALLSGALSLSSSSHSSMSGGSASGGGSGEDVAGNDHGNGKGHEEDAGVISDSQHHHQRHHHQHRRDLPLDEERNSVTESSNNSYDGDGASSAASQRSTPLCSRGENDGSADSDAARFLMSRQATSRGEGQRVAPAATATATRIENKAVAPPGEARDTTVCCSRTAIGPADNATAVDYGKKESLATQKTKTTKKTRPTATKNNKKKKKDGASKKTGSNLLFDDDHPSDLVKPKRPMSAYNFFFRDERARIIAEGNGGQADNPPPSSAEAATNAGANKKRPHRKISFEKLGKIVGQRWRDIDDASLKRYNGMAQAESTRYHRDMDAYYKDENARRRARYMSGLFCKNEVGDDTAAAIAMDLDLNVSTATGLMSTSNTRMAHPDPQGSAAPTDGAATTRQQQQPAPQGLTPDNNNGAGSNNHGPAHHGVANSSSVRLAGGQQQLGAFQQHQNLAAAALQLGLTPLATLGWSTGQTTSAAANQPPNIPQAQAQQQTVPQPITADHYLSLLSSMYGSTLPSMTTMVAGPSAQNQFAWGARQHQPENAPSVAAAAAVRLPASTGPSETTSRPSPQGNSNDMLPRQNKRRKVTLTATGRTQDEQASSSSGGAASAVAAAEVCSSLTESNASDSGETRSNEASSGGSSGSSDSGYDTASGSSDRGSDEGAGAVRGDGNVASGDGGGIGIARLHLHDFKSCIRRLGGNDNEGGRNKRVVGAVKRSDSVSASSDKGYDTASGSSDWRSDMSFVSFDKVPPNKGGSQREYAVEKKSRKGNQEMKKAAYKTQSSSGSLSAAPPQQAAPRTKRGRPDGQEARHTWVGSSASCSDRGADRCIRMNVGSGRAEITHSSPTNENETSASSSVSPSRDRGEKSPAVTYSDHKSPRKSSPESAAADRAAKGAKQSKKKSAERTGDDSRTKPKGPMSAYNFFFIDEQEKILAEYPASPLAGTDCAGRKRSNRVIRFEELDKEIGQRWRDIGSDTLKKYAHMAEKDTARYRRELNDYYDENDAQRHSQILSEIGQGADDRLDTEASGLAQGIPRLSNSIRAGHARSESSLTLSAPLTHAAVEKNMASNSMPSAQELFALLQQRNLLPTSSVVDGCIVGRNLTNAYSGDLAVAGVGLTGPSYNSTGQITQMMAPLQSSFAPKYQDALGLLHSNGASSNGLDTQISPNGNGILLQTTPTAAPSPASLPLDNALLQIYAAQRGVNPAILQAAVMRQNGASCSSGFQGSMNNEGA